MANTNKKVDDVIDTTATEVQDEPTVDTTEEVETDETKATETQKDEKKEFFIKRWWNGQVAEFKAHPVKKTGKVLLRGVEGALAVIGAITVVETVKDGKLEDSTVEVITDKAGEFTVKAIEEATAE